MRQPKPQKYKNHAEYKIGKGIAMEEKTYKLMSRTGAMNITFGVICIVTGITAGVMLIIGGARLLAEKSKILF